MVLEANAMYKEVDNDSRTLSVDHYEGSALKFIMLPGELVLLNPVFGRQETALLSLQRKSI